MFLYCNRATTQYFAANWGAGSLHLCLLEVGSKCITYDYINYFNYILYLIFYWLYLLSFANFIYHSYTQLSSFYANILS
jgi:hypothetical protein